MTSARPPLVAVVAALTEELAPLRMHLSAARRVSSPGPGRGAWRGRVGPCEVVVVVTGDGARSAQTGVAAVLDQLPVDALIAVGAAGALDPTLALGQLVRAEAVRRPGRAPLRPSLVPGMDTVMPGVRAGTVLTVAHIVGGGDERRTLGARHPDAAVVDLESACYAEAALERHIPWAVLRAVSDTADDEVPALLERCRDEGGRVQRLRVVGSLLRAPGALPALLRLRGQVRVCGEHLAAALVPVLHAWPGPVVRPTYPAHVDRRPPDQSRLEPEHLICEGESS